MNDLQIYSPDAGQASANRPRAADQKFCFSCGQTLHFSAASCPRCGAAQPAGTPVAPVFAPPSVPVSGLNGLPPNHVFCRGCGRAIHQTAQTCPQCGAVIGEDFSSGIQEHKDRVTAAILALFLGGIGAHKFYLGSIGEGILYLLFFWTAIPAIIGFIEGIIYLTKSDEEFWRQYG